MATRFPGIPAISVSIGILASFFLLSPMDHGVRRQNFDTSFSSTVAIDRAPPKPRRTYQYSIVPGGVFSQSEYDEARGKDKIVASHYADLGREVRLEQVEHDVPVYVSYRKGLHVFWTSRRHTIQRGEFVLADGHGNWVRARCGNRLSRVPRQPTEKGDEPPMAALELPEFPVGRDSRPFLFVPEPEIPSQSTPEVSSNEPPLIPDLPSEGPTTSILPLGILPTVIAPGLSPQQAATAAPVFIPPPPPVAVPEPKTLLLLALATLVMGGTRMVSQGRLCTRRGKNSGRDLR